MFATLRYNQITQAIEQPPRISQRACTHCRARKIRCSAAEDGCDRCKARKLRCEYPQPARRKGPRLSKSIRPVSTSSSGSTPANTKSVNATLISEAISRPGAEEREHDALETSGTRASFGPDNYPIMHSPIAAETNQSSLEGMSLEFLDSFDPTPLDRIDTPNLLQVNSPWAMPSSLTLPDIDNAFQSTLPSAAPSLSLTPHSNDMLTMGMSYPNTSLEIPVFNVRENCHCQTIALRLQESLCIVESQCSLRNVGRILRTSKHILVQCSSLLDCAFCSTISYFMMLLTIICQRITSCFGKVLVVLTQQYNRLQNRRERQPHLGLSEGNHDDESRQMTIRDYDLDPKEELCLFGALTLLQLQKLRGILDHIREVTTAQHWDLHTTIIDQVALELFKQIGLYDKPKSIEM